MGIFNSYIFGKLRKSVGNVTTYELNGQQVARGKVVFKHDPKTPAQLEQRARMKMVRRLAREMTPAVREGFPGATLGRSTTVLCSGISGCWGWTSRGTWGLTPSSCSCLPVRLPRRTCRRPWTGRRAWWFLPSRRSRCVRRCRMTTGCSVPCCLWMGRIL